MSNQARLLLLSGTGGSGTSTLVDATAASAHDEGLRVIVVDAVTPRVDESVQAQVRALATAWGGWPDADEVPAPLWSGLEVVRHLAAWQTITEALAEPHMDVVIVDGGTLREVRALVAFASVWRRLLDAVLTPSLAMRGETATESGNESDFATVERLRDRLAEIGTMIESSRTTMRIVCPPEDHAVTEALRGQSALAMLGVQVEGLILNRFARKSDGFSRERLALEQAQLERAERESGGSWVWKSTRMLRPVPKDRSVIGPLGGVPVLRVSDLAPRVDDEAYSLVLPLVGAALEEARVGRSGDDLVVEFDGLYRWLPLPSMLRRCRAIEAVRTADGLVVSFVPDAALWRSTPDPEQVA